MLIQIDLTLKIEYSGNKLYSILIVIENRDEIKPNFVVIG